MESLIMKGGWVMAPILIGSVVALTLVLERIWYFWGISLDTERFAKQVFTQVGSGGSRDAAELCEKTRHPLGAVLLCGLERAGEEPAEIERAMEREGMRQIQGVEKNLNYLMVVIGVEPLLGFLGTILGLIQAFMAWEKLGTAVTVSSLAAGIYQAMLTTAAGLIVAIPYYVIYNIFLSKVTRTAQDMNHYGSELVSVLAKAKNTRR